jgi:hypothetical protein
MCSLCCANDVPPQFLKSKFKSTLYYVRQSVGQSVLVSGTRLGLATNFSHSLFDYFFLQFRDCWCGAPSLTRRRVCTFQFLPGIASAAFLRSEFFAWQPLISYSDCYTKQNGAWQNVGHLQHTGNRSKLKLNYGQFVLVSGNLLGPVTNLSFSLKFSLDSCGFVIL